VLGIAGAIVGTLLLVLGVLGARSVIRRGLVAVAGERGGPRPQTGPVVTTYDGEWEGTNNTGKAVRFTVQKGRIRSFSVEYQTPGVEGKRTDNWEKEEYAPLVKADGTVRYDSDQRITVTFGSPTAAQGTYHYGPSRAGDVQVDLTWTAQRKGAEPATAGAGTDAGSAQGTLPASGPTTPPTPTKEKPVALWRVSTAALVDWQGDTRVNYSKLKGFGGERLTVQLQVVARSGQTTSTSQAFSYPETPGETGSVDLAEALGNLAKGNAPLPKGGVVRVTLGENAQGYGQYTPLSNELVIPYEIQQSKPGSPVPSETAPATAPSAPVHGSRDGEWDGRFAQGGELALTVTGSSIKTLVFDLGGTWPCCFKIPIRPDGSFTVQRTDNVGGKQVEVVFSGAFVSDSAAKGTCAAGDRHLTWTAKKKAGQS
jgi:hypothetical protein